MFRRLLRERRARLVLFLTLVACGGTTVAFGYLTATSQRGDTDPQVRSGLPKASTPTVPATSSASVQVSIPQITVDGKLLGEIPNGGYRVKRYATTSPRSAAVEACGGALQRGTTAELTCTDTVPSSATYKYFAVGVLNAFTGPDSDDSGSVVATVPAATPPATPTDLAVTSPGNTADTTVTGKAAAGTTVRLYTNALCTTTAKDAAGNAVSGTASSAGAFSLGARVSASSTTFYATAANTAGASTCSTSSATYVYDTTAPTATDVRGTNAATGTAGILGTGDGIEYVFSETMKKTSILSTWTDTTATVTVRFSNAGGGGNQDVAEVLSDGSVIATLGSLNTKGNYVASGAVFNATLSQNGSTVRVTLGTLASGTVNAGAVGRGTPTWTFGAGMTDLAGNALPAGSLTSPNNVVQF
jgi:hypothetical protein